MTTVPAALAITSAVALNFGHTARAGRYLLLGLIAWLMGKVFTILVSYAKLIGREATRALPVHIVLIGASYIDFITIAALDTTYNIRNDLPVTWVLPARFVGACLGVVALRMMSLHLSYERKTKKQIEDKWLVCCKCGSSYAAEFCARCGAKQPCE